MRYIDIQMLEDQLPEDWKEKASKALENVRNKSEDKRAEAIDRNSRLWRGLKNILMHISNKKCWYCESLQVRSDNAVDHYRPKNQVAECPEHSGYWWLAFEWENYRFSCTYCNSRRNSQGSAGGKQDHFPLWDESKRARCEEDSLDDEQPLLLDPTCIADPTVLWFDEDGFAVPNPASCEDSDFFTKKAESSISIYHLNHPGIVEQRKILFREIQELVKHGDSFFKKYKNGDGTAREAFANCLDLLSQKIKESAEYSAAAKALLMGLRGYSGIVEVVLQAA